MVVGQCKRMAHGQAQGLEALKKCMGLSNAGRSNNRSLVCLEPLAAFFKAQALFVKT